MRSLAPIFTLALVVPAALAWTGDGQKTLDEVRTAQDLPPVPVTVTDPPERAGFVPAPPPVPFDNEDGGQGEVGEVVLDDAIPLPIPAVYETGADGDHMVQPPSGDPFFLGFEAGRHFPPQGENLDPLLAANVQPSYADGRPEAVTYGFAMFDKRITPERIAELESLGVRVLGFHPHYTLRVAVPVGSVDALAAHDAVQWLGVARPWQKVHSYLTKEIAKAPAGEPLDAYVTVFESDLNDTSTWAPIGSASEGEPETGLRSVSRDPNVLGKVWQSNGWQQRQLEALGLEVVEYVDGITAFRVKMHPASLEQVVALDFVQFVESDVKDELNHDESTPQVMSDYVRQTYDGSQNSVAIAAQIDSGVDYTHNALNHFYWVNWNFAGDAGDGCEHGSHVAGTLLGWPATSSTYAYRGQAPMVGSWGPTGRYRNVKYFNNSCGSAGTSHSSLYGSCRGTFTDGSGNVSQRPHVINNSWGAPGTGWVGSEANARTLDNEVYIYNQLYVFSAGNSGSAGTNIGLPGVAKNAFTVGAITDYDWSNDPGELYSGSSRGPAGDGRWKPNIAAPGRWIRSVNANNNGLYTDKWGTSMAAPHVTGVAAGLVDHYSYLRYQPARLAAAMMTAAFRHNNISLSTPSTSSSNHLNMYGAGKLNAFRSNYATSDHTQSNWGFTNTGSWNYADFSVVTGTTRIVVTMTYHEIAASSGASSALVNDLDLWIDSPSGGIDPGGNTGEWFAQQSPRDNTEIRVLNNPLVGTWRWKVYPDSYSSASKVSVVVSHVKGDTTPNGTLSVTASDTYVQPNDNVNVTATAYNPDFNASSVFFDSTSSGDVVSASTRTLDDGAVSNFMSNQHAGRDVLVGSIRTGASKSNVWTTRWASEGIKTFNVSARSDNWVDRSATATVYVDGTGPAAATNLVSTSHTPNVWSNDTTIDFTWTTATDNLSGTAGYSDWLRNGGPSLPNAIQDFGSVTSHTSAGGTSSTGWWYNLRAVDRSGNWSGTYARVGPYLLDAVAPGGVGSLASSTHVPGQLSCNTSVTMTFNPASDAHSGIDGYNGIWDHSAGTVPGGALNIGAGASSYSAVVPSSGSAWYFHIRSRDKAGNWGSTVHSGPYQINSNTVSTYCTGKLNSAGCTPAIGSINPPSMSANNFVVTCNLAVNKKNGLMFFGGTPGAVPFQGGLKCVLAPTKRTPLQNSGGSSTGSDCTGSFSFVWTQAFMLAKGISIGDTVYCQWWYRDPSVAVGTTGLSNALRFTVCQ